MKAFRVLILVALTVVLAGVSLSAHHAWPVDFSKLVTVRGTVTEVMWGNPHPMYKLDVRAADGSMEAWEVGGPTLSRMESNGWNKTTLKPGDVITGIGYKFLDGKKIIRLEKVVLASGKEMAVYGRL